MKLVFEKLLPAKKQQLWMALGLIGAALVVSILWDQRSRADDSTKIEPESIETAATYIPAGFVLVPIEVANYESLDSILGKFGVVDLFVSSDDPTKRPRKLAERVKILRAPLNPNHFAVLVPETESQKIVAYSGALTVVVQNPRQDGPGLVLPDTQTPRPRLTARRSRVTIEVQNVQ